MKVHAYPVPVKEKCKALCLAFLEGAGAARGEMVYDNRLREGAAFFYGVNRSNVAVWRQVLQSDQGFFYSDNSYFDATRHRNFRVACNRLQHPGVGSSDGVRLKQFGVRIEPWRKRGRHVLVCPQSDAFMHDVIGCEGNWLEQTLSELGAVTDREIRVRHWGRDKARMTATLAADLVDAHCVVTWSSAAAVNALLAGVPCIVEGDCAAAPMASTNLRDVENPPRPDGREQWAAVLADNEWSLDEWRNGAVWAALSSQLESGVDA